MYAVLSSKVFPEIFFSFRQNNNNNLSLTLYPLKYLQENKTWVWKKSRQKLFTRSRSLGGKLASQEASFIHQTSRKLRKGLLDSWNPAWHLVMDSGVPKNSNLTRLKTNSLANFGTRVPKNPNSPIQIHYLSTPAKAQWVGLLYSTNIFFMYLL